MPRYKETYRFAASTSIRSAIHILMIDCRVTPNRRVEERRGMSWLGGGNLAKREEDQSPSHLVPDGYKTQRGTTGTRTGGSANWKNHRHFPPVLMPLRVTGFHCCSDCCCCGAQSGHCHDCCSTTRPAGLRAAWLAELDQQGKYSATRQGLETSKNEGGTPLVLPQQSQSERFALNRSEFREQKIRDQSQ